jgi:hypothetical protein
VPLKVKYLKYHLGSQTQQEVVQNNEVVEEFIKVTGRSVRSDTFSRLKHRKILNQIFEQLYQFWIAKQMEASKLTTSEHKTDTIEESKQIKGESAIGEGLVSVDRGPSRNESQLSERHSAF